MERAMCYVMISCISVKCDYLLYKKCSSWMASTVYHLLYSSLTSLL